MEINIYDSTFNGGRERERSKVSVGIDGVALPGQRIKEGEPCWIVEFDKTGKEVTFKGIPKTIFPTFKVK